MRISANTPPCRGGARLGGRLERHRPGPRASSPIRRPHPHRAPDRHRRREPQLRPLVRGLYPTLRGPHPQPVVPGHRDGGRKPRTQLRSSRPDGAARLACDLSHGHREHPALPGAAPAELYPPPGQTRPAPPRPAAQRAIPDHPLPALWRLLGEPGAPVLPNVAADQRGTHGPLLLGLGHRGRGSGERGRQPLPRLLGRPGPPGFL